MDQTIVIKECRGLKTGWIQGGRADRPILYFLHGYPDTAESWDQQFEYFKEDFQIVAPYTRGALPSERSAKLSRYGLDAVSLDHLEILQHVDPSGQRPVVCIGHDLGGIQAWHLANLLGNRLKSLIIINSLALGQIKNRLMNWRQLQKSWYVFGFLLPKVSEAFARNYPARMLRAAHNIGELSPAHRPKLGKNLSGVVNPLRQYRALAKDLLSRKKTLSRVHAPVLVLWGSDDSFLETIKSQELEDFATNVSIRILRGNHWLHREQSDTVNRLIKEFVCS